MKIILQPVAQHGVGTAGVLLLESRFRLNCHPEGIIQPLSTSAAPAAPMQLKPVFPIRTKTQLEPPRREQTYLCSILN